MKTLLGICCSLAVSLVGVFILWNFTFAQVFMTFAFVLLLLGLLILSAYTLVTGGVVGNLGEPIALASGIVLDIVLSSKVTEWLLVNNHILIRLTLAIFLGLAGYLFYIGRGNKDAPNY